MMDMTDQDQYETNTIYYIKSSNESLLEHLYRDDIKLQQQECTKNRKYESENEEKISLPIKPEDLQPGDHVYIWKCAYLCQQHAIVLSVSENNEITVVEFYSNRNSVVLITTLQEFCHDSPLQKVQYSVSYSKRIISRSGTVSSQARDPQTLIYARLQYLIGNPHHLPTFNALSSNDESICVWISTGFYCTLQVCSQLFLFSACQAKSALFASRVVSHMGVPLTTAQPVIIPLLVGYGLVSFIPLEMLRRFKKKWKLIEEDLNQGFWEDTPINVVEKFWMWKNWNMVQNFFDGDDDVQQAIAWNKNEQIPVS